MVNTRFWVDEYISELTPNQKLLFLYFLTNPYTDICGVYEVPLRNVVFDTGLPEEEIKSAMVRFESDHKIVYHRGWVYIKNFAKHQLNNPKVKKGIMRSLSEIPPSVLERLGIVYDSLSHLNLNSNSNSNSNLNLQIPDSPQAPNQASKKNMKFDSDYEVVIDTEGSQVGHALKEKPNVAKAMWALLKWAQDRRGSKFPNVPKQFKAMKQMRAAGVTPESIKTRWEELENDKFYQDKGLDFASISSSFDRKPS